MIKHGISSNIRIFCVVFVHICILCTIHICIHVRILYSTEEGNLPPFDSKIACLCQSTEINNNKYVYTNINWTYVMWISLTTFNNRKYTGGITECSEKEIRYNVCFSSEIIVIHRHRCRQCKTWDLLLLSASIFRSRAFVDDIYTYKKPQTSQHIKNIIDL